MKVCVIGTGYVGLVTGTCLSEMGNDVICVDIDQGKIDRLNNGEIPIYEPGLEELIEANTKEGRLSFSTDLDTAVKESLICFIAVGTPQSDDGTADLSAVFAVARSIAQSMDDYKVVVGKSTVPVGTIDKIQSIIEENSPHKFSMVSNPEFLKQGAAVDDFLKPDRVVVGANDQRAMDIMQELYSPFLRTGNPIILMDIRSAEMTKYVANAFLATKISFINEMSKLCEHLGADITQVRTGICSDTRIGTQFLFPGIGYGGSCFPKDVKALINTAKEEECRSKLLEAVDAINQDQRQFYIEKIYKHFNNDVKDKTFAIWGLSFKPRTDDMREAPSITIIKRLLADGAKVQAYDPKAIENAKKEFNGDITYCKSNYDALKDADALLLVTEWNEFRRPNFEKVKDLMRGNAIFDGRNQYEPERMARRGFDYHSIGRQMYKASTFEQETSVV